MQLFNTAAGERVCVGLDMIWLDFMSRRPLPLEDGETTISRQTCLKAPPAPPFWPWRPEPSPTWKFWDVRLLESMVDQGLLPQWLRIIRLSWGVLGRFPRVFLSVLEEVPEDLPFHPRRRRRRSLSEDMIRPFCNPSRMPRLKRHSFGRKPLVALHLPQGCISDVPEIDTFVSEVESKRFFNKESSKVLSGVFMEESPRSSRSTVGMSWTCKTIASSTVSSSWDVWVWSTTWRQPGVGRKSYGLNASCTCLGSPWRQRGVIVKLLGHDDSRHRR